MSALQLLEGGHFFLHGVFKNCKNKSSQLLDYHFTGMN